MQSTPNAIVWHMAMEMNIYQRAEMLTNNYLVNCYTQTSHKLKTKLKYIDNLLKKSANHKFDFSILRRWNSIKHTLEKVNHTNLPILYEYPIQIQFNKIEINIEIGEITKQAEKPNETFNKKINELPHYDIDIYTDGSGKKKTIDNIDNEGNSKAGAAFYVYQINKCESFSLSNEHSPETLEAVAIIEAIKYFKSSTYDSCRIISDAKNLINKLNQQNRNIQENQYIMEIKFLSYRCQVINKKIMFVWCPSHIGIENNEKVDKMAKEGRNEGRQVSTMLTSKEARNILKSTSILKWKNELEAVSQISNNNYFKLSNEDIKLNANWFKKFSQKPTRKTITIINRIRCNHHRTNSHLHKLSIIPEPKCKCGYEEEDLNHMIFSCPINKEITDTFTKFIQTKGIQAPYDIRALAFSDDTEILTNIVQAFASMDTQL